MGLGCQTREECIMQDGQRHSMSKRLSLRWNFAWNLLGNGVYAVCQWGMVIVLAKLTSPDKLGSFALGVAIASPVFLLSGLALRPLQATDAQTEFKFGHYLALRLVTSCIAMCVLMGIAYAGGYTGDLVRIILAVGLSKVLESVADVLYGLMQRHERMDKIAWSRIAKGSGGLLVMTALIAWTGQVFLGVLGFSAVWGLMLLAYDLPQAAALEGGNPLESNSAQGWRIIHPQFEKKPMLRLAWMALPVGIVMGLGSLKTTIPRYFIERYCGVAELGIFAALAYLIVVGSILVGAMAQACSPRLAQHYSRGNKAAYIRLLLWLIGSALGIGCGGILLSVMGGRWILSTLYRSEYANYLSLLRWLMVAGALTYVAAPFGYAMTAARYLKMQLPLFILACGATLATAGVLIPSHGLHGAAFSLVVGTLVQIAGSMVVMRHAIIQLGKRS